MTSPKLVVEVLGPLKKGLPLALGSATVLMLTPPPDFGGFVNAADLDGHQGSSWTHAAVDWPETRSYLDIIAGGPRRNACLRDRYALATDMRYSISRMKDAPVGEILLLVDLLIEEGCVKVRSDGQLEPREWQREQSETVPVVSLDAAVPVQAQTSHVAVDASVLLDKVEVCVQWSYMHRLLPTSAAIESQLGELLPQHAVGCNCLKPQSVAGVVAASTKVLLVKGPEGAVAYALQVEPPGFKGFIDVYVSILLLLSYSFLSEPLASPNLH